MHLACESIMRRLLLTFIQLGVTLYLSSLPGLEAKRGSIGDVTLKEFESLLNSQQFLGVYWYGKNCRTCDRILSELDKKVPELEESGVKLVKLNDKKTAKKYGIRSFPSLTFFKGGDPLNFQGDLSNEEDTMDFLTGPDALNMPDRIEEVQAPQLRKLIESQEYIAVLFYISNQEQSSKVMDSLEMIDEKADKLGVAFVKINDLELVEEYQLGDLPSLVYYRNSVPIVYEGSLTSGEKVLEWIIQNRSTGDEGDVIEDVNIESLETLVSSLDYIAVLFYDASSRKADILLELLEKIDDDCDAKGVHFVKLNAETGTEAISTKYGVNSLPTLVFFNTRVPNVFDGQLMDGPTVLQWIVNQVDAENIEEVTGTMLHRLVKNSKRLVVLFYESDTPESTQVLNALESIDDDCDKHDIIMVKISDNSKTSHLSSLETCSTKMKYLDGSYIKKKSDEVEEVNLKILEMLLDENDYVSTLFYDKLDRTSKRLLTNIENIDDDFRRKVHRSRQDLLKKVFHTFKGDLTKENTILGWILSTINPDKVPQRTPPIVENTSPSPTTTTTVKPEQTPENKPKKKNTSRISQTSAQTKSETPIVKRAQTTVTPSRVKSTPLKKEVSSGSTTGLRASRHNEEKENVPMVKEAHSDSNNETLRIERLKMVEKSSNLVVFFYENLDKVSNKVMSGLKKTEEKLNLKELIFLNLNANDYPEITVSAIPSLVYFKSGKPIVYTENMMNEGSIYHWVLEEYNMNKDVIEHYASTRLRKLIEENVYVMVYLYNSKCSVCEEALKNLEEIDDDMEAVGVMFVKTDDNDFIKEMGIEDLPSIIYFENSEPSIYDGNPGEESELLTWLLYQMKEDTIENINRQLLFKMIGEHEFLAVFFYENDENSLKMLRHLELIDDEVSQYGARIVKINDALMSKKYGHRNPPGLGYFRKGNYIKYDGDIFDDEEMLDWLTDPNIMEISDQIEKVNTKMFEKLRVRNEHLAVLFYTELDCKQCQTVLKELENIDDDAEASGIPIVKLEDKDLGRNVGVFAYPSIVIFRNFGEEAVIYSGDLKNKESILEWLLVQKDPGNQAIESMEGTILRKTIEASDSIAVFMYTQDERCINCISILQGLENIDDDAERHGVDFLKTTDETFSEEMGIHYFPGLVHIQDNIPNIYDGNMDAEEEILDWLIEMKVEHNIELITRPILESMVQKVQYMAVFFIKQNCRTCDQILVELEKIDDECDSYGILMVRLKDPQLAKRYGIKTFPSLVYFRNGNPLTFEGDLKDEMSVLEWLIDDENRELDDEIEAVNFKMLIKLIERSELMAVFFYDQYCNECEVILEELERIDDEADMFGIDFIKNDDPIAAKHFLVFNAPSLVYFRHGIPITYDGDLLDGEKVLSWLTSKDVFELKDFIEPVNRKLLDKLLDENDFVAVFFYTENCKDCDGILSGLEKVDADTEGLDITFVRVNDPRYAKKYGVNKLPSLVYFRRRFPSIYRESLHNETEILDWLKSNRYKTVELDLFMYAIVLMGLLFLLYTAFLHFGFRPQTIEKKKKE
ncbi:unnamed protein product [Lepeophtheirus salmonis]|uniref:(salmon louse) hypothetical protein n=1 Tax=Lepeophtheirus salmonis TaxID=72036 RepID=A0A7R8D6I1_LEPSM|nr:unnamed protein product [Lepeophtheirus salmonis]CAF3016368.1 unnamed protein product [Lepeophtheirus salmonis]